MRKIRNEGDRCWNYSTTVGESSEHPTICDRCVEALSGKF
ncbi:MAG: zinc finger domain-containing protein [Cyanobacteria bacterium P01_C01_bin.120]